MSWKYTDATNTVAFRILENGTVESMLASALPEGNIPDPADTPDPKLSIIATIVSMETTQLLPRITREFMLGLSEITYPPEALALNEGYNKLKAFDEQIINLRNQL
jgi:hypothetical protein